MNKFHEEDEWAAPEWKGPFKEISEGDVSERAKKKELSGTSLWTLTGLAPKINDTMM